MFCRLLSYVNNEYKAFKQSDVVLSKLCTFAKRIYFIKSDNHVD